MYDQSSLTFTLSMCAILYLGFDCVVPMGLTASEVAKFTVSNTYGASVSVDSSKVMST